MQIKFNLIKFKLPGGQTTSWLSWIMLALDHVDQQRAASASTIMMSGIPLCHICPWDPWDTLLVKLSLTQLISHFSLSQRVALANTLSGNSLMSYMATLICRTPHMHTCMLALASSCNNSVLLRSSRALLMQWIYGASLSEILECLQVCYQQITFEQNARMPLTQEDSSEWLSDEASHAARFNWWDPSTVPAWQSAYIYHDMAVIFSLVHFSAIMEFKTKEVNPLLVCSELAAVRRYVHDS